MGRVLVIGAGPMGIATAIGALDRGLDVTVLERDEAGSSLRTWGATRFFSPLHMNVSARMRALLGDAMPDPDALLTGPEFADLILAPLAERAHVRAHHNVIAIGRRGLTRGDYAGHPLRAERPFRVVCDNDEVFEAEIVLDASGGLVVPRAIGAGGLPARGESHLGDAAIRTLGDLMSHDLRGKHVLVVGDGHSAANAIVWLEKIDGVQVTWAIRTANLRPCEAVMNDPLPERAAIVDRANALAASPPPFLRMERRAMIESVARNNGHVSITLSGGRTVVADRVAAFTGYRPDDSYLSELAVEVSPVTEGGARLYRAIANITDCLTVPKVAPRDLESGEENFYFVGSRAYGRSRSFLLQTGLAQLEVLLDALS
jgi:thioredoxin reductase